MRTSEVVKEAWGEWIASMGDWHVFGGLTYDHERRTTVPGADVVRAHCRSWLRAGLRPLGREIEAAVVALEYQKSGWPHLHPLLRLSEGLQSGDFAALGQAWFGKHGYARLEAPRSRADVCAYASKYLSKDLARGDVIFWPARGQLATRSSAIAATRPNQGAPVKEGSTGELQELLPISGQATPLGGLGQQC